MGALESELGPSAGRRTPAATASEASRPLRPVAAVVAALVAVVAAPSAVLLGAPLALGAPHLVQDLRWLVLRRRMPPAFAVVSAIAIAALIALRALEVAGRAPAWAARSEACVAAAWLVAGVLAGRAVPSSSPRRRGPVRWLPFVGVAAVLAVAPTPATRAALMLLHNVVALALWVILFRAARQSAVAVSIAVVAGVAVLAWVAPALVAAWGVGTDPAFLAAALAFAPGAAPTLATRWLECVLFLQLVHYATWLAFVPASAARRGQRLLRRRTELAVAGLVALAPVLLAVALRGLHPHALREAYLSLAVFHAYLELAVWAFVSARGDGEARASESAAGTREA